MKIIMICVHVKQTRPLGDEGNLQPLLYKTIESALEYIDDTFPNASNITDRLKTKYSWKADNIPMTFFSEIPSYDSDGEWDYSTEYVIELIETEVHD